MRTFQRISIKNERAPSKNTSGCLYNMPPPQPLTSEPLRWQPVATASSAKAYVFSAYYDRRWNPPVVTVIGIASEYWQWQGGDRQRLCRMWFSGEEKPRTAAADFKFVPETHGRTYASVLYTCTSSSMPYAVSMVTTCSETAKNLLKVIDTGSPKNDVINAEDKNPTAGSRHYTVCNALLHSNYSNFRRLVETIELNRMFGAQRHVIYNMSSSPEVRLILDGYVNEGLVEIIPWESLPVTSWDEGDSGKHPGRWMDIHYFGQVAALNDCLYRNIASSTFVLFADLDEVVVPRISNASGSGWSTVLERATREWSAGLKPGEVHFPGVYMVRSAFFQTNPQEPEKDSPPRFEVWLKTDLESAISYGFREDHIFDFDVRSKYFASTKAAVVIGIHFPYELIRGDVSTVYVSEQLFLLHHYRPTTPFDLSPKSLIKDDWILENFGRDVTRRLRDRRKAIMNYVASELEREIKYGKQTLLEQRLRTTPLKE